MTQKITPQVGFDLKSVPTDLFIGGKSRDGSSGKRLDVFDPSTGVVIAAVADASIEDALDAVSAAYEAGPAWAATAPRRKSEILRRCFELMIEGKDMLAELISLMSIHAISPAACAFRSDWRLA
ncbi:aldehyde dehydrogenase family protein [Rhizobium sp. BK529]|nr:aldehyde dehydrogenase family protein [Rhizobium sp. BK418]